MRGSSTAEASGVVRPGSIAEGELYTLAELRKRLDLGPYALRPARKKGLPVLRIGRKDYIRGLDLVEFAVRINSAAKPKDGG